MPTPNETGAVASASGAQTAALRAVLFDDAPPDVKSVRIVDVPKKVLHRPSDILGIVTMAAGIAIVLAIAYFARDTTEALTSDIRGFVALIRDILRVPTGWLQNLVALILPVAVVIELGIRRLGRQVIEAVLAFVLGLGLAIIAYELIRHFGSAEFIESLSILDGGTYHFAIPWVPSALVGLLTVSGPRARRRTVRWAWPLLWAALALRLVTMEASLAGVLMALLIGRMAGRIVLLALGVASERAYGQALVDAVHRAGFMPTALVRVQTLSEATQWEGLNTVHDTVPLSRSEIAAMERGPSPWTSDRPPTFSPTEAAAVTRSSDPAAMALARSGDNRVYAMLDQDGLRYDVVVLDGDRQGVGFVSRLWRMLRLRGLEGRAAINLKSVAERTALLSYSAAGAGVRTPRLLGLGMAEDSAAMVMEHARGAVSLRELGEMDTDGPFGDFVMAEAWKQLRRAHAAGLSHRQLTADVVLMHRDDAGTPHVWIAGWDQGDVASNSFSRRLDQAQMLAMLALRFGPERAVTSAAKALPDGEIAAIGPLLQTIALPTRTREEMRSRKGMIDEIRTALVEKMPEANVEPARITRFGPRTVIMAALLIAAGTALVGVLSFDNIQETVSDANLWWLAVAFAIACFGWVGASLSLVAFTPGRIPLGKAVQTQMAASFVAVAMPAGVGPAAINLRMLTKRGVSTPMAVATVALVQVTQVLVTFLVLLGLVGLTGASVPDGGNGPPMEVLIGVGVLAAIIAVLMLVPPIRRWVWAKAQPTLAQIGPRLAQILSQPLRLAIGLAGNLLLLLSTIVAFWATLQAFGQGHLPLVTIAIIYLTGNTAGAIIPTPGGAGPVELALIAGLAGMGGIDPLLVTPIVLAFRLLAVWLRVPIGWVMLRHLDRKGDI